LVFPDIWPQNLITLGVPDKTRYCKYNPIRFQRNGDFLLPINHQVPTLGFPETKNPMLLHWDCD